MRCSNSRGFTRLRDLVHKFVHLDAPVLFKGFLHFFLPLHEEVFIFFHDLCGDLSRVLLCHACHFFSLLDPVSTLLFHRLQVLQTSNSSCFQRNRVHQAS